jgi:4-amino-4-deoxy-L-arabinose transferase-like glycosyltransferase
MTIQRRLRGLGWKNLSLITAAIIVVIFLMLVRLGSLTKGLSQTEIQTSSRIVGWHGLYNAPFNLPLKIVRSIIFFLFKHHGQSLTRLANAIFGLLAIGSFAWLSFIWHGKRTALLVTGLFATSAWTLHVSRLASSDVSYLWGIVSLLLANALIMRKHISRLEWLIVSFLVGLLLTIPGFIWLIGFSLIMQKSSILQSWSTILKTLPLKLSSILLLILWLPLTIINFFRPDQFSLWLGLPKHLPGVARLAKQFAAVLVHLFFRGPQYPTLWLGKSPLLDAFSLFTVIVGIYFYARHWKNHRARIIAGLVLIGIILVGLGGLDSFSLMVGLMYVLAAMGISYLLHAWFTVFPSNPLARSFGVGLISLAVFVSCLYNLRSYFVAWPHSPVTQQFFSRRL